MTETGPLGRRKLNRKGEKEKSGNRTTMEKKGRKKSFFFGKTGIYKKSGSRRLGVITIRNGRETGKMLRKFKGRKRKRRRPSFMWWSPAKFSNFKFSRFI